MSLRVFWLGELCLYIPRLLPITSTQGLQPFRNSVDSLSARQVAVYPVSSVHNLTSIMYLVFFMIFGGLFVGKIYDDYGHAPLLLAGSFFHVFGLIMTSLAKTYYQILLSQAVCSALGASMVIYPAFTAVSLF